MNISKVTTSKFGIGFLFLLILTVMPYNIYAEDIVDALTSGKTVLDIRVRYENVDQKNSLQKADALTVRTRLGYETADFNNIKAYIEAENTIALIEDYNSKRNGKPQYSVVADPEETEINQFLLSYKGIRETEIKLGRQRIKLDNARFIGNVGWRQLEQTYDAAVIRNTSISDTVISYGYIGGIKDIFSKNVDINAHTFNVSYKGWSAGTLTGYGYLLDLKDAPASSQMTFGVRFSGNKQLNALKLLYTAEYAKQSDYKDGNNNIDSEYMLLEVGADTGFITAKLGYEQLGADNFSGFETPLATKHAFNGWADQFLGTPTDGLRDYYLIVSKKIMKINLTGVYHEFKSDSGNIDYGTEFDFLATRKINDYCSAGFKYSDYNADSFSVDTQKLWLWMQVKF